ncbi:LHFPL tetraspan subfamily member 6 protein-like [Ruditapes philippinarum]|uniref:LHFPL tetraspan subfamily member 6 protein-like n=1 Tax=Ruditapes philippinarum TaxID=129788 RepID=UPI00295B0A2A|nr:LHFPL tetraspan subfamily member 6 protein-like [Ruditapes philippinarum]XP_060557654.1 LHFPL tetraspan subfamily member 6 protein-like [Ruditapes philippinarum]XP_060557655.1 LHFPL tetraspan subfamily member 6 protein-like [Ruditapes philippinarum]
MSGLSGIGIFWAFSSFISSVILCIGYFVPYWLTGKLLIQLRGKSEQTVPVHFGIFRRCNYPTIDSNKELSIVLECGRYTTFMDIPSVSWQIATLVVGLGCSICLLVSLTAMFGVCVKGVVIPTVARTAGVLQMCSGLLIGTGVGIYPKGWDSPEVKQACGNTSKSYYYGDCTLSWCFYITCAGIGVTLICSALAFHSPKRKHVVHGYAI